MKKSQQSSTKKPQQTKNHLLPPLNDKEEESDHEYGDDGTFMAVSSVVRFRKSRKNMTKRNPRVKVFERRYTELGPLLLPEQRRIDYILVHDKKSSKDVEDKDKKADLEEKEEKRERFEDALKSEGFNIQHDTIGNNVFVKLHCPFKRLCAEAEIVKLEKALKGVIIIMYT
ncbi:hypothetical protein KUTeg_011494 [Tegillarca granosa]|uniref:Anoctamin dimerisation domain-containing protein n=1 Tax=Tegillarca granosa TaxID=220873 RepID=A0ABQ9E3Q8_TEGGR|nr:hypothetical protein KUTeg_024686 [Tegillarca granosa]KAJ8310955.1 hypothetical protein KUTeg_011494 [Tegillarca granosa]